MPTPAQRALDAPPDPHEQVEQARQQPGGDPYPIIADPRREFTAFPPQFDRDPSLRVRVLGCILGNRSVPCLAQ
jgi:hypothetical protein